MNKGCWVFPLVFVAFMLFGAWALFFITATGATVPTIQEQRISALETKVKNLESDWDRFIRQNNKLKK